MNKADPKMSKGARMERKAFMAYLKRWIAKHQGETFGEAALNTALKWVEGRHKRYDAKPGGLGK